MSSQGYPPEGQDILRHRLSPHEAWWRINADGNVELIATNNDRDPIVIMSVNRTTGVISTPGTAVLALAAPGR